MKSLDKKRPANQGFALIVTLSLMILLTVIAVGLLTLSSIALRSSSQGNAMATARANARVALMLAIGELQLQTGPDTRITARADILDANNPPVFGAWKSWEGTDHESSGRPISPGNYASAKKAKFLRWLVSGNGTTMPNVAPGNDKVTLVGSGSVGSGGDRDKLQIHLLPSGIGTSGKKGAFAWWTSGENCKARLPEPYQPSEDTAGRWAVIAKSHAIPDPSVFGMDNLLSDPKPAAKAITLKEADFITTGKTTPVSQEFFHDLSTSSVGLLTNVATGGWKKDLSLFTENWQSGARNIPFFRVSPGKDLLGNLPTPSNATAQGSMIYPWASYRGGPSDWPIRQHGPVSSWENLKDYALIYQRINADSSGRAVITPTSEAIDGDNFKFLHRVRILPVIARIQWVFSYISAPAPSPAPAGMLEPRLLVTPVITMWNPYNLEMTFSNTPLEFNIRKPLPVALKYTVGSMNSNRYRCLFENNTTPSKHFNNLPSLSNTVVLQYRIKSSFKLLPGETKVFSPASNVPVLATQLIDLEPKYRSRGGHYFSITDDNKKPIAMPGNAIIKADAVFDTKFEDQPVGMNRQEGIGIGIYLDMLIAGKRHLAYRMVYSPEVAASVYKPASGMGQTTLAAARTAPVPFMTTVFGARMASKTHLAAKGFVQSSPLVNFTAMGGKDLIEPTIGRHYGGTNHPVNSPFDFSFDAVTPFDSLLPNESDATGRGYIVTGFTKADGLSRCVVDELPTRPLLSLPELQNWDMRYENPIPPFAFNLIGNSDASPLLPPDAVVNSADANLNVNLQHDDSYCANHLLFDDWFFSSIAKDPTSFGRSGKDLKKTYTDFVSGVSPLGNHSYQPIQEDAAVALSSNANGLYSDHVATNDAWKTIASRLEVKGMFNVNSTSVTAWRALLGHARNQKIPYIKESSSSWSVELSNKSDHAFSRFSVAGDAEATQQGSSGAFPEAAEFAGYRILDDKILDALAEEVVNQIRQRGPFLSLSEFVNRQLSSGDLALAGTIQAALNEIAKNGSTNPYAGIERVISREALATPASAGDAEYKFPAAAVGQSTYGLPGWTRQADILRALAPDLSARDDTFTLRAYGDARDASGKIVAKTVCEAVIRRSREYVDPVDKADITTSPTSPVNQIFGRRYQLVSFRWLGQAEI